MRVVSQKTLVGAILSGHLDHLEPLMKPSLGSLRPETLFGRLAKKETGQTPWFDTDFHRFLKVFAPFSKPNGRVLGLKLKEKGAGVLPGDPSYATPTALGGQGPCSEGGELSQHLPRAGWAFQIGDLSIF